ncbi:DODA-type extradiol aromatic ring-opening family dioxygenase [Mariprofundus ferrooxydans]|uniref:DODA-type extradiol aromatic ring-opening family dioxygenase n=1 Tax=Mariprofundus ferrooxydans TaxID=314344 RepID=UPI000376889D|nr:class III extradiol ring-cleavage dioxygenase [Mariprofundus ferrooxydans]
MKQPAWFLGHGAPFHTLGDNLFTRFWQTLPGRLPVQPRAVLCISAHWQEPKLTIAGRTAKPAIQHDFYGFSEELYRISWPVPDGNDEGHWLLEQLEATGIAVSEAPERAFDHGVWAPLRRVWPLMPLPLFQLSLVTGWQGEDYLLLGQKLARLREQGILIIGSGNLTHNLQDLDWHATQGTAVSWATDFMEALEQAIVTRDSEALVAPLQLPHGKHAHPTLEHYWPLLPVIASGDVEPEALIREWTFGTLAMHSYTL